MILAWIACVGIFAAAEARRPTVPDLFRPDPRLTFLETRGQLLPQEARRVGLRVEAIDTLELRARPVSAKDHSMDDGFDTPRRGHSPVVWPVRMRLTRPRDSLTTWTAWLDLDRLAARFPGSFLEVKAIAGPRAFLPTIQEAHCDSVWTWGRFLVSDLGVVATRIHPDSLEFQTFDLSRFWPWPGVEIAPLGKSSRTFRTDSTGRKVVYASGSEERWRARSPGPRPRIALIDRQDLPWAGFPFRTPFLSDEFSLPIHTFPHGIRLHPYVFRNLHLPGDTLVVGCLARVPPGVDLPRRPLLWRLTNQAGTRIDSGSTPLDPSGHAQWRWVVPDKSWQRGYRIEVFLGEARERLEVAVEERQLPRSSLEVRFDSTPSARAPFGHLDIQARWNTGRPLSDAPVQVLQKFSSQWSRYRTHWSPPWPFRQDASERAVQFLRTDSNGFARVPLKSPNVDSIGQIGPHHSVVTVLEESGRALESVQETRSRTWVARPALRLEETSDTLLKITALWYSLRDSLIRAIPLTASLRWDAEVLATWRVSSGDTWSLPASVMKDRWSDPEVIPRLSVVVCRTGTQNCVGEQIEARADESGRRFWSRMESDRMEAPDGSLAHDPEPRSLREGDSAQVRWESDQDGFAWIRVLQGERTLLSRLGPSRRGSNLWTLPTDSLWWPGVRVAVFELSGTRGAYDWIRLQRFDLAIRRKPTPLGVSLRPDSVFRPNSLARIRLDNPLGRTGSVVVSATDQAILDLTDFRMADPSRTFETLDAGPLRWWNGCGFRHQLYAWDQSATCATEPRLPGDSSHGRIPPPFPSDVELGGGGGELSRRAIPRFSTRPLGWVSSVTALRPGITEFVVPVPSLLGRARIRAVVSSGRDAVVLDTSVAVRSSLEGSFTTPFFLEPGDTTHAVVRVFGSASTPARARLDTEGPLRIPDGDSGTRQLDPRGMASDRLPVVGLHPGEARIRASFHQGADTLELANELEVRGERLRHTEVLRAGTIDGSATLSFPPIFSDSGLTCRLEVSNGPILGLDRRIRDLRRYPHECLEQVVSRALADLLGPDLGDESSTYRRHALKAALRRLEEFPRHQGLLGLWPRAAQPDTFASVWALQFLSLARSRTGLVELDAFEDPARAVAKARLPDPTEEIWRLSLLPRLGLRRHSHPELFADFASLDSLGNLPLSAEARWILALAWKHRGQAAKARLQMDLARTTPDSLSRPSRQGRASRLRDQAWALEATMALGDTAARDRWLARVAPSLEGDVWLSTQESGALLVALAHALPRTPSPSKESVRWRVGRSLWKELPLTEGRGSTHLPRCGGSIEVEAPPKNPLLRLQTVREGILRAPEALRDFGFDVSAKFLAVPGVPLDTPLREGASFQMEVRIRNTSPQDLDDIASTTWIPAGWTFHKDAEILPGAMVRHVQRRADRIVHHFSLPRGQELVLRIPLRAVQEGSYRQPEVVVEDLYDASLRARWTGERARVVR